ncbi:MAG: right-handed parallel beta-helix repeat-containing protein, partial [Elusimicrobiota bacterium]
MSRIKRLSVACSLLAALFAAQALHAATYYVATTGNDANPGTGAVPWKTVAKAVNFMVAGDTTYVRGGVYAEGVIRFNKSGTQAAPIKLLNYPGEFPIIDFVNGQAPTYDRILIQHASGYNHAIGWITIEGFEIRDGFEGIKYYNLHDSVIRRNWIHDNVNQGVIGPGSTRVLITQNRINHNGPFATNPTSTQAHGLYLHGSALTITNNVIYDNLGY